MFRMLLVAALSLMLAASPAAGDGVPLSAKNVLRGKWAGEAKVEQGKWEGQTLAWQLEFAKGDFSQVSGQAISSVKEVKAGRVHPKKPFKMTINYEITGGGVFAINTEAHLDPTCTKISGTFKNVMGNGSFELTKQDPAPDASLAGSWKGTLTAKKGRWLKKGESAALSIGCPKKGSWEGARAELEGLAVQELVPSIWDEAARGAVFFVRFQEEGKDKDLWLQLSGTFSEDGRTFSGEYDSAALGSGDVKLER